MTDPSGRDRSSVRTGVVLPSFRDLPDDALRVADQAEEDGVDGVFCYDHLWPMGQPHRPAIAPFPLLGAIARRTSRVHVGTLVARVGLVPDDVLLAEFDALSVLAPGRVVAGLGTGDHLSAAENTAYGVPPASADERRAQLASCARVLRSRGIDVWVGGGSRRTLAVAEEEGVTVNLWGASTGQVAVQAARGEVTWAGPAPGNAGSPEDRAAAVEALVPALAAAGASWVVLAWPAPLRALVRSAEEAGSGR